MKKVITFGVFDLLHYGHILLFKRCKEQGDYLIVAVHSDEYVRVNKPDCELVFNEKQREEFVKTISYVDEVILYDQIDETIKEVDFDVLVVGPDQTNPHFVEAIDYAKRNGKTVVELSRTPNISSSILRREKC